MEHDCGISKAERDTSMLPSKKKEKKKRSDKGILEQEVNLQMVFVSGLHFWALGSVRPQQLIE